MKRLLPAVPLLLAACAPSRKAVVQKIQLDTLAVTAKPLDRDRYQASAPRDWDILHTDIHLNDFDRERKTVDGRAVLTLKPYAYAQDSLTLDAKSMTVSGVTVSSKRIDVKRFQQAGDQLRIWFGAGSQGIGSVSGGVCRPSDTLRLDISYTARPYQAVTGGSAAIKEDRGLYFINTDGQIPEKPRQIWTQGETESNSHWFPTIDKPNERFTTDLFLRVADSFTTLSNGLLVDRQKSGPMRTDHWRMNAPIQPYAVMFAIGTFAKVADTPWHGKEVAYYVEPDYAPYAKGMFRNTPAMIEFFSKKTGVPYPWPKYSQIVVRDYVSGAMENTSASLFGEFMNQDFREQRDKNFEDVVSHELFHQWFGDYATAESWANLTVNESFATYGEVLWREHRYGAASADALRWDDLQRYLAATERGDPPLVRFGYADKEDLFDRISYQKGGAILHFIRGLAGDAAFDEAMRLYLTQNALQPAEAHHWRLALEEATGRDWNPFFNQWYFRGGHPELDIRYQDDTAAGALTVAVTQKNAALYQLPLKTGLFFGDTMQVVDWLLSRRSDTFVYAYRNGRRPLVVPDVLHWLPGTISENKTAADWLAQYRSAAIPAPPTVARDGWAGYRQASPHISRRLALLAVAPDSTTGAALTLYQTAVADADPALRQLAFEKLAAARLTPAWKQVLQREVVATVRRNDTPAVRAAALAVLRAWKDGAYRPDIDAAIRDSSYMVAGAALLALEALDSVAAYDAASRVLQQETRGSVLYQAERIVAQKGAPSDFAVLTERPARFRGVRNMAYLGTLAKYAAATPDSATFDRTLDLLQRWYRQEPDAAYRQAQAASPWYELLVYLYRPVPHPVAEQERRQRLAKATLTALQDSEENKEAKAELRKLLQVRLRMLNVASSAD